MGAVAFGLDVARPFVNRNALDSAIFKNAWISTRMS